MWWIPRSTASVVRAAAEGGFDLKTRQRLAAKAFAHTATYDNAVATWTASQFLDEDGDGVIDWPAYAGLALERSEVLRYGENPHQQAALYVDKAAPAGIAQADQLHGKAMSYNNFVDADAALRAALTSPSRPSPSSSTPTRAAWPSAPLMPRTRSPTRMPRRTPATPSPLSAASSQPTAP